jgi:hypothetical protein
MCLIVRLSEPNLEHVCTFMIACVRLSLPALTTE